LKKTVRTTITIPVELKDRLDKAGKEVNWSAVAARALDQELNRITTKRCYHDSGGESVAP
jgi:hypothetical protein